MIDDAMKNELYLNERRHSASTSNFTPAAVVPTPNVKTYKLERR